MLDNYGIVCLMFDFNRRMENVDECSEKAKEIEYLYAQAIRMQCNEEYGNIMVIDDFIDDVKNRLFVDYDGYGYFLDIDGNEHEPVHCNAEWLEQFKGKYPFIVWFNK